MKDFAKPHTKQQYYTRAIDITFTLVLIFFTIVFVDYVMKSVEPKTVKTAKPASSSVSKAVTASHLKLRQKKRVTYGRFPVFARKTKSLSVKHDSVVPAPAVVNQDVIEKSADADNQILPVKTAETSGNSDASEPKTHANPDFLYQTRLKSNETGVINLRETDRYNAHVIKTIPTGSLVLVLEKGNNYYKIQFESSTGYVPKWTLETK